MSIGQYDSKGGEYGESSKLKLRLSAHILSEITNQNLSNYYCGKINLSNGQIQQGVTVKYEN